MDLFLNGHHYVGTLLAEAFEIQVLDIVSKRHLPRFLIVVVQFAQLFWIHSKFTRHLDLGVGKPVALTGIDPGLHFLVWFLLFGHLEYLKYGRHNCTMVSAFSPFGLERFLEWGN